MKKLLVAFISVAAIGILFFLFNSKAPSKLTQPSPAEVSAQEDISQAATTQPDQTQPAASDQPKAYTDPQQNFKVTVPAGFSDDSQSFTYDKYFSSQAKDVQLTIEVSQGEYADLSDAQSQAKDSGATVSNVQSVTVDGVTGSQQTEDNMNAANADDKGCALSTYFQKNGKIYSISMFSIDGCDTVNKDKSDYDSILNSFQD